MYNKFFFLFVTSAHTFGLELLENPMFFRVDGNQSKFPIKNSFKKGIEQSIIVLMDLCCFNILHNIEKKSTWRNDHRFLYKIILKMGFHLNAHYTWAI